jgi:hypothetical protein
VLPTSFEFTTASQGSTCKKAANGVFSVICTVRGSAATTLLSSRMPDTIQELPRFRRISRLNE